MLHFSNRTLAFIYSCHNALKSFHEIHLQGKPRFLCILLDIHWYVIRLAHPHKPLTVQTSVNMTS